MRAVQVMRHGDPADAIEVVDAPVPEPGPGEVRIRAAAASLNFGDIARCRGGVASVMAEPPFTLGMDVSGVVDAAGDGGEEWVGRRVVALAKQSLGGIAEEVVAPATSVFAAPDELDDAEAAAFTLPFHISYLALHERAALAPGETVAVVGGASAVGTACIQLALAAGARVIALAGTAEKGELCRRLGAETTITYGSEDVFARVMDATGGVGADVVCDMVGGAQTETIWTCVARGGRYLPIGFNDDVDSGMTGRPLRKVSMGNFSVVGVLLAYANLPLDFRRFGIDPFPPETGQRVHAELCALVTKGSIRPVIGRRIGMEQVAAALEDHAARRTTGRTVVEVARS